MESLRRYGWECTRVWRGLSRTGKAYSATQVVVIGTALAVAIAVFALVDGVLSRTLAYGSPEELYLVQGGRSQKSYREIQDWARALPNVQIAGHQQPFIVGYTRGIAPVALRAAAVTDNFLAVLGVRPALGDFVQEDFWGPGGATRVLISDEYHRREFGGRADVVGRTLPLSGAADHRRRPISEFRIAGVLPPDFVFPSGRFQVDVVLALRLRPDILTNRSEAALSGLIRLPQGQSRTEVESLLTSVAKDQGILPKNGASPGESIQLNSLDSTLRSFQRTQAQVIATLATALLVLALVNSAALSVARMQTSARELRVRVALGASPRDQWRLAAWHALLLTLLALCFATVLGSALITLLAGAVPTQVVLLGNPELSWRALSVAAGAAMVFATVIVIALTRAMPTLSGPPLATATPRRGRVFATLTALQAAFSCVLIVGGLVFVGSVWSAWGEDTGFSRMDATLIELNLARATPEARTEELKGAVDGLSGLGSYHAGAIGLSFLGEIGGLISSAFERPEGALGGEEHLIPYYGDVFDALGLTLVEGRWPSRNEARTILPIALVSEAAARQLWPNSSPVGKTLVGADGLVEIIGVVSDARYIGLDRPSKGEIYKVATGWHAATVVFGGAQGAWKDRELLLQRIRSNAPHADVLRSSMLREALARTIQLRSFRAWIFGAFSVCGIVLTCISIVGMVLMSSATRTRELAIRVALGSTRWGLLSLLVREPMLALTAGILAGLLMAGWTVQYAKAYSYGVSGSDPMVWVIAAAVLVACAVVATVMPGLRVTRVDAVAALRQ